ncbi:MAG: ABC transporter permease subunit [Clostridia bacterium]|nr:ABC transporter permease subunit [Clostridia bacterium]
MNILLRELKAHRKALIIWSVCMFLFVLSGMAKYSAYSSGAATDSSLTGLLNSMPVSVKALLGFGSLDVSTMAGYFAMLFIYMELTVAIHAALLGAGIIAKEEGEKTTEYLMVKPVSRAHIITSKLIAALINVVVLNLVTLVSSLTVIPVYNKGKSISGEIVVMLISMFFVQLIFLSLGALLAACMRNPKGSGSIATGILLIGYFAARVTDMTDKLNILNVISPFKYFDLGKIVAGNGLSIGIVLLSLVLVGAFTALTYLLYQRRDLKI